MTSLDKFQKAVGRTQKREKENKEVWGYTKVITSKDQSTNKSLVNQDFSIRACADAKGWFLARLFGGTYESASGDFNRKEFVRLVAEVKKSKKRPYAILICQINHLPQTKAGEMSMAYELVERLGVHLYEISTGKNTFTEHGKSDIYCSLIEPRTEPVSRMGITVLRRSGK